MLKKNNEKKPPIWSADEGQEMLDILGITTPVSRIELIFDPHEPVTIRISHLYRDDFDEMKGYLRSVVKDHVLVEKDKPDNEAL